MPTLQSYCAGALLASFALAAPSKIHPQHQPLHSPRELRHRPHLRRVAPTLTPKVSGTPQVVGQALDSSVTRDSCGSSNIGGRLLWTCRDTSPLQLDGLPENFISSSSASWSDLILDGPALGSAKTGVARVAANSLATKLYGTDDKQPFFPIPASLCGANAAGMCPDGTRYAMWPDSPPMVSHVSAADNTTTAYTWIRQSHIDALLTSLNPHPATTLYRLDYHTDSPTSSLPTVTTVAQDFYPAGAVSYGNAGNLVHNGTAYLYGSTDSGVALAKVPASSVEDVSKYKYYQNGAWTSTRPFLNATPASTLTTPSPSSSSSGIDIPNVSAGGQGTYYFSTPWNRFVWIGQASMSVAADFYITTSPSPEGPWAKPTLFYEGQSGNYSLGAYSLQAHPYMVAPGRNEIWLSWTKNDIVGGRNVYSTPLVRVVWE